MNARIEWIEETPSSFALGEAISTLGKAVEEYRRVGVGATAAAPAQYADCNIAAPSAAGQGIVRRLQAMLQREVPGSGVLQTGFLDAETCAAWRDYTADKPWMRTYPGNFNITNILDTLDGASVDANNRIVHHWKCNGPMVTPDCTQVPARGDADPCPEGMQRDETTRECVPLVECPSGQQRDSAGQCVPIVCGEGEVFDPVSGQCITAPPKTSGKKKKSTTGLLLLASAAAAAIAIATQV